MHHVVTPGFVDRSRRSDGTPGQLAAGPQAGRPESPYYQIKKQLYGLVRKGDIRLYRSFAIINISKDITEVQRLFHFGSIVNPTHVSEGSQRSQCRPNKTCHFTLHIQKD